MERDETGHTYARTPGKKTTPEGLRAQCRTGSIARCSRATSSTGRVDSAEGSCSRAHSVSFDELMLGGADDDCLPRRSQNKVLTCSRLAASISEPLTQTIHDAVNARFREFAVPLTEALCSAVVEVSRACAKELQHELAGSLAQEVAARLPADRRHSRSGTSSSSSGPSLLSVTRTPYPHYSQGDMTVRSSKSGDMVSKISKTSSRACDMGPKTSRPGSDSSRDVKALEGALADQLLEESGLQLPCSTSSHHGQDGEKQRTSRRRKAFEESMPPTCVFPVVPAYQGPRPEDVAAAVTAAASDKMASVLAAVEERELQEREEAKKEEGDRGTPRPSHSRPSRRPSPMGLRPPKPPPSPVDVLPGSMGLERSERSDTNDDEHDDDESPAPVIRVQPPRSPSPRVVDEVPATMHTVSETDDAVVADKPSVALRRKFDQGRHMTAENVLQVRVEELTENLASTDSIYESERSQGRHPPPLALRICGLTPFVHPRISRRVSRAYQVTVLILTLVACCGVFAETALARYSLWDMHRNCKGPSELACWRPRGLLSDMSLAIALVAGMATLEVWRGSPRLVKALELLQTYTHVRGIQEKCRHRKEREMKTMVVIAVCAVVLGGVSLILDAGEQWPSVGAVLSYLAYSYMVGALSFLCFCLLYISRVLTVCSDSFCCKVVDDPDLALVAHEWNVLQAVLRKTSSAIELPFVAILFGAVLYAPLLMVDFFALGASRGTIASLLPGLIVLSGLLRLFFLAAAITDKCLRIPPLMNSLSFGPGTERYRQYIVDYITNSAAGFYLFDTRLTIGMVLKFIYVWGVLAFGFGTQVFSAK